MPDLAGRGPLGQRDLHECGAECKRYMRRVKALCICVVCLTRGYVDPHHSQHGRFSQRKKCDKTSIPLCRMCHDDFHKDKAAWADRNGFDYDFIPLVEEWLEYGTP